jgi:hypothetical protein
MRAGGGAGLRAIDPAGLQQARLASAERWFRTRPQFGNESAVGDAPAYTSEGTLPLYLSHLSSGAQAESQVRSRGHSGDLSSRADATGMLPPAYASGVAEGEVMLLVSPARSEAEGAMIRAGLEDVARVLEDPGAGVRVPADIPA